MKQDTPTIALDEQIALLENYGRAVIGPNMIAAILASLRELAEARRAFDNLFEKYADQVSRREVADESVAQSKRLYEMTLANEVRWMQRAEKAEAALAERDAEIASLKETITGFKDGAEDDEAEILELHAEIARLKDMQCHHGWRGLPPTEGNHIQTPCPECGCKSLFIGDGGHLTCARVPGDRSDGCPNPGVEDVVKKLKAEITRLRSELSEATKLVEIRADQVRCMTKWLDDNQPDVWARGIWDSMKASIDAARGGE
jgi:hypothetical protein